MIRSLTEITVEHLLLDDVDHGEHVEITIEWAASLARCDEDDAAAFGHPTEAELIAAAMFVAGLLARLAWVAHPWLAEGGQQHRCSTRWFFDEGPYAIDGAPNQRSGCSMTGVGIFNPLKTPLDHTTDGIGLWLRVPAKDAELWLDRIGSWLQVFAQTST